MFFYSSHVKKKKIIAENFLMEISIRLSYPLDSQSVVSLFATRNSVPLNISYTCHVSVHPDCVHRLQGLFLIDQYDDYKRASFKASEHSKETRELRELNERVRCLQQEVSRLTTHVQLLQQQLNDERDMCTTVKHIALSSKSRLQHHEKEIRRLSLKLHEFLNMDYPIFTTACTDNISEEKATDVSDALLPHGIV